MNRRPGCIAAISLALSAITLQAEAPFNFETTPGKLPKDVVPKSYDIQLKPEIEKLTFTGSETVVLEVRKPVKEYLCPGPSGRRSYGLRPVPGAET